MTLDQYIHDFQDYGKLLHEKNFIASCDGNISCRHPEIDEILISASGVMKGHLKAHDIVRVPLNEKKDFSKNGPSPSSELSMHLQVYKNQPQAKAVIHAHPPTSIAFSVAFPDYDFMPLDYISELRLALGQVPIVPYQRPGSEEMGKALLPYLQESKVMILARHGVISWGESMEEAYRGVERIEHACEIFKSALQMKGVTYLPKDEVETLKSMRKKIGFKTL